VSRADPPQNRANQNATQTADDREFEAAKAEYEASSHDETAGVRYVTRLAEMRDQVWRIYAETGDKAAASNQAAPIDEALRKHPMPRSVDSRKLKQLLIGEWNSPRHTYVFRADGTYGAYGVSNEQRIKWRIDGNEFIDDFSRGPIILLDRNRFIYAFGEGVMVYDRANDSEAEPVATPASAVLVDASGQPVAKNSGRGNGNVKVTFTDGHSKMFSKDGKCLDPKVSSKGYVGWIHYTHLEPRGSAMGETW